MVENFIKSIFENSRKSPLDVALVQDKESITYEELTESIVRYKLILEKLNIQKKERVAILLPNTKEFIYAFFAVVVHGAIAVPVSFASNKGELKKYFNDSTPTTLLTISGKIQLILKAEYNFDNYLFIDDATTETPFSGEVRFIPEELSKVRVNDKLIEEIGDSISSENRILSINYTYNGNGKPLGCVHTLKSYNTCINYILDNVNYRQHHRSLAFLPFNHIFSLMASILPFLALGAKVVLMKQFKITNFYNLIERYRITHICLVPFILKYMERALEQHKDAFKDIEFCVTGGEYSTKERLEKLSSIINFPIVQGYGLTEYFIVTTNQPEANRFGTLGKPLCGEIELKLEDTEHKDDNCKPLKELYIKSDTGCSGYWEGTTEIELENSRWFATGDFAEIDSEGYLHFHGRKKKITKVGGLLVDITEVEKSIAAIPGVDSVELELLPDPLLDNRIVTTLSLEEGSDLTVTDIKAHLKQNIASYKVPVVIKIKE